MSGKIYVKRNLLLVMIFLINPLFSLAQTKPLILPTNANHQIEYIENFTIPHTSQSILFRRALNWMVTSKAYKFKKVDLMDNEFGRLIASGRFIFNVDEVFLSLAIDVKENKAQLRVTGFDYNMMVGNIALDNLINYNTKEAKVLIPQTAQSIKLLLKSFRDAMMSNSSKI